MIAALRFALGLLAACLALPAAAQVAAAPGASASRTYVIYASISARRLFEKDGVVDIKTRVNRWRDLIAARGSPYTITTHPSQLAQVPAGAIMVLPSALVLDDEERAVIERRLAAGDSLLATGMPGTIDASGAAGSAQFVEKTFNVKTKAVARGDRGFLITVADTPLTSALAPGTRVWIGPEKYPAPLLAQTGAGYLSDWSRAAGETGLIALAAVGPSRRVLLGWTEAAWDPKSEEQRKLAEAALDWVEGRPAAYVRTWPWPYRGAMTVGIDALWRFENVPRVAAQLSQLGAHGSFHFISPDVEANAAILRDLPKGGHGVGGFGDATRPFAGRPEREQALRVERMVDEFHRVLGADFKVSGLRAPQGATDEGTEKAAASLDYLVDVGRVDALVPVLAKDNHLALLTSSANLGAQSTGEAVNAAIADAMGKALVGGYAFIGLDAAGFNADSPMGAALAQALDGAKERNGVWLGSATEVAAWWRERSGLKVATAWQAADNAMDIDVTLAQPLTFPTALAIVPPAVGSPRLEAPVPGVELVNRDGGYVLVLTGLSAGTHRLRVRFQP